jgi:CRP-like cAMP-binding protein
LESLFKHINSFTSISADAVKALENIIELNTHKAGTILCNMGDYPHKVYFLKSGFARGFATSKNETYYNRAIYTTGEFMASLSALIQNSKAELALECLTDCETIETNYHDFIALGKKYPEISVIYAKVLELNFIKLELSNIQMATMNATERYLALRKRIPRIDNSISQYHIASHLGITPIQLSRIRKSLSTSK